MFSKTLERTTMAVPIIESLESRRLLSLASFYPVAPEHVAVSSSSSITASVISRTHVARAVHASPAVTWASAAPSPIDRFESAGAVVGGKVYVFGGFINAQIQVTSRSDVYDPKHNTWTQIADMPEPLTHTGHLVIGRDIWFVGGFFSDAPSTNHSWIYHTRTNTWTAGPSLPEARGAGTLAKVGAKLYFFGGLLTRAQDQPEQWVLDLRHLSRGWIPAAPMPVACNHLASVVFNGKIYAIGGQHLWNEDTDNVANVQVYNPHTNVWTQAAPLPTARGHIADSTFIYRGRFIVIGGSANGDPALTDVLEYRPGSNTWSVLSEIPSGRRAPVAVAMGNKFIVTTGDPGNVSATPDTFVGTFRHW